MDKEQLLQKYKIMGFNDLQMIQIESAIEASLPEKQIDILAKFKYEANKMKEIRLLLEHNLNAKLNLSQQQLEELIQNKRTSEIILTRLMYEGKIKKRHKNKILTMFNDEQIDEITYGLENSLPLGEVEIYANPKFNKLQMKELRLLLEYNKIADRKLTKKQIQFITNHNLKWQEMQIIKLCYENNISQNETQKLLKMFNDGNCYIDNISYILTNKMNIDKIYSVFDEFDSSPIDYDFKQSIIYCCEDSLKYEETIRALKNLLDIEHKNKEAAIRITKDLKKGMSPRILLRNNFNHRLASQGYLYEYQSNLIELATKNKFTEEEIDKLAFLDYTSRTIFIKRLLEINLKTNAPLTPKELLTYIFDKSDGEILLTKLILEGKITNEDKTKILDLNLDRDKLIEIYNGLNDGLSLDEVKIYAKPEYTRPQMEEIRLLLEHNKIAEVKLTDELIQFITNPDLSSTEMELVRICYERDISQNEIEELLNTKFDAYQLKEIIHGLEHNLSLDEVKIYASLKYYPYQMAQIRLGLEHNLTLDKIKLYAKPEFKYSQMKEIRKGLENGLSLDEVRIYANPEFDDFQMEQIRLGLEHGLSVDEIKAYANPDIFYMEMKDRREQLEQEYKQNKLFKEIIKPKTKLIEQNDVIEQNSLDDLIANNPPEASPNTDDGPTKDGPFSHGR